MWFNLSRFVTQAMGLVAYNPILWILDGWIDGLIGSEWINQVI